MPPPTDPLTPIGDHLKKRPTGRTAPLDWWVEFGVLVRKLQAAHSEGSGPAVRQVADATGIREDLVYRAAQAVKEFGAAYLRGIAAGPNGLTWEHVRMVMTGRLPPEHRKQLLDSAKADRLSTRRFLPVVAAARKDAPSVPGPKARRRTKPGAPPTAPADAVAALPKAVGEWLDRLHAWQAASAGVEPGGAAAARAAGRLLAELAAAAQEFAADLHRQFPEPEPGPEPGPARPRRKTSR